jgi:hypothetical protein
MRLSLKTLILLTVSAINWQPQVCTGQAIFSGGTEIHSGDGEDQQTKSFKMKGPYVLRWELRDLPPSSVDEPWWKPTSDENWKRQWLSMRVYDATTRELICSEVISGRQNHLSVPKGGRHYLLLSGPRHVAWIVWGKEGKVSEGGAGGKLVPLPAAESGNTGTAPSKSAFEPVLPPATPRVAKPSSDPDLPPGMERVKKTAGGG